MSRSPFPPQRRRFDILFVGLAGLLACDPTATDPPPPNTAHSGTVSDEVWGPQHGMHRLIGDVIVSTSLTIQPGTRVCGEANTRIVLREGTLEAVGSADAPIVLTACDTSQPWGGIIDSTRTSVTDTAGSIQHAVIEHALVGIRNFGLRHWTIAETHVRQIQGPGLAITGILSHSLIDSTCLACAETEAAVTLMAWGFHEVVETTIRDGGANGLNAQNKSYLTLRNVHIEGHAGNGFTLESWGNVYPGTQLVEVTGLTVTGNGGYGIGPTLALPHAIMLLPDSEAYANFSGNGVDTLYIADPGGGGGGDATIYPGMPWQYMRTPSSSPTLRVRPGGVLLGAPDVWLPARLLVDGTAENPALISGFKWLTLVGSSGDTSVIRHARIEDVGEIYTTRSGGETNIPLILEDAELLRSRVVLNGAGSRVRRTTILDAPLAAVEIRADDVVLGDCAISGGAGDGVLVASGSGVVINDCNLTDNVGFGVNNATSVTVDARRNWWGDPAGPNGPAGDGVSGDVDTSGHRTAPVTSAGS